MRKTKEFSAFGVEYRTTQMAASPAFEFLERIGDVHPLELFVNTDVKDEHSKWIPMGSAAVVNEYVQDVTGSIPPRLALAGVVELVNTFNFGFLYGWSGVKVPTRFKSGIESSQSSYVHPVISQLIQDGVADLQKLEEYYSLEDAFRMFDIIVAKGVNTAKANEEAMKKAKKK